MIEYTVKVDHPMGFIAKFYKHPDKKEMGNCRATCTGAGRVHIRTIGHGLNPVDAIDDILDEVGGHYVDNNR